MTAAQRLRLHRAMMATVAKTQGQKTDLETDRVDGKPATPEHQAARRQ